MDTVTLESNFEGFQGIEKTDVDCAGVESAIDCGVGAVCVDVSSGVGYTCTCGDGYSGSDVSAGPATCVDIDGCTDADCGPDATCGDVGAPGTGYICNDDETLDQKVVMIVLIAAIVCVFAAFVACRCCSRRKHDNDLQPVVAARLVLDPLEDPETGKQGPAGAGTGYEETSALQAPGGNETQAGNYRVGA